MAFLIGTLYTEVEVDASSENSVWADLRVGIFDLKILLVAIVIVTIMWFAQSL
jgi:hypothetical protein